MGPWIKAKLILSAIWIGWVCISPINAHGEWHTMPTEELAAKIDQNVDICLVNVLPKIIYDNRHIPGSINVPISEIALSPLLPDDKRKQLIFYCMGTL